MENFCFFAFKISIWIFLIIIQYFLIIWTAFVTFWMCAFVMKYWMKYWKLKEKFLSQIYQPRSDFSKTMSIRSTGVLRVPKLRFDRQANQPKSAFKSIKLSDSVAMNFKIFSSIIRVIFFYTEFFSFFELKVLKLNSIN